MQKEFNFYQEMAPEQRLQENGRGPVPLYTLYDNVSLIKSCMIELKQKNDFLLKLRLLRQGSGQGTTKNNILFLCKVGIHFQWLYF